VAQAIEPSQIRYAKSGDIHIAYMTIGDAPLDLVVVPGYISHLEIMFENPKLQRLGERLTRFARLIVFDKRGTGMSDPVPEVPTLEQRMDDVRAVMDAAGSERAALLGISEGASMCVLFAATYPERTQALVLYGGMARSTWAPDYPWASPREALLEATQEFMVPGWGSGDMVEIFAPSEADDPTIRAWYGRVQRMAASPGMQAMLQQAFLDTGCSRHSSTPTSARPCRSCRPRLLCYTGAATGWSPSTPGAILRDIYRGRSWSNFPVSTTRHSRGTWTR